MKSGFQRATRVGAVSSRRSSFTLIELLIVMVILVIVLVLTVTAFNFSLTGEQLRSAAQQIQSYMGGARDRAIYAREPRGVRFFVDQTNPRTVTSMVYIGPPQTYTQGTIRLERRDDNPSDGIADGPEILIVKGDQTGWFKNLLQRKLIGLYEPDLNGDGVLDPAEDLNGNGIFDRNRTRIKIPADLSGTWYTVLTSRLTAANEELELLTHYIDPGTSDVESVVAFQDGGPSTYILELPPAPLQGEEPILLPKGIVIDLDGSVVPDAWRPRGNNLPYFSQMDILISPRGNAMGAVAASGLIHFYLAEAAITDGLRQPSATTPFGPIRVTNQGSSPRIPADEESFAANVPELANVPIGDRIIVTLFTQTGRITTHPVDTTDSDGDGWADQPYEFAIQGEIAGQ